MSDVVSTVVFERNTTTGQPFDLTLPSGLVSGNHIYIVTRQQADATPTLAGFTLVSSTSHLTRVTALFYRLVDGTEGASASYNAGAASRVVAIGYQVANHDPTRRVFEWATDTIDPPLATTSWGTSANLYLAFVAASRTLRKVATAPSGYTNLLQASGTSSTNENDQILGGAQLESAATSSDPSAFTFDVGSNGPTRQVSLTLALGAPAVSFAVLGVDTYRHGAASTVTVAGADGAYTLYWSPTTDHLHADAISLSVTGNTLDGNGDGTITATANRGTVKYETNGYVILVQGAQTSSFETTLLAPTGHSYITGSGVIAEWATSVSVSTNDYRWYSGNLYQATTTGTTGATPPTHTTGTVSDGAVSWAFVSAYSRLTGTPDLVDGDMVVWYDVKEGVTDRPTYWVEVFPDFSYAWQEDVTEFKTEAWRSASGYTAAVTHTSGPLITSIPALTRGVQATITGTGFGT